ncbi:MAG TPA: hypothetical protein VFS35_01530, partial [Terrimicrobiaceae bacterium]|nr:hypothetical protein [Terrimicrobiaceae bacterium]
RAQLDRESKFEGLARVMLVRADPKRQDELFAWPLVGLNPDAYWANKIDPIHMEYLIDTADFGANEFLRLLYLCGEIPAHLRELDLPWRAPEHRSRDPNFSRTTEAQIRDLLLSFKYWIDDPFRAEEFTGAAQYTRENNRHEKMEKGREMTFWSENHRILFATVEYLAGQFFPDEIFTSAKKYRANPAQRPGDMVGRDHTAHARPRVLAWLNECLRLGFAEWCAPGYFEQDLLALFNLADFALEEEVRTRAAMALDLMVFEFARFSMGGAFASSTGRAYFESKNCVWEQSIRDTMEILFGSRGHFVATTGGAVFLATSTGYRPPDVLLAIGASPPKTFTDRSRVSINLDEAGEHGIGFDSDDDVVFWWSRAGYATKETIDGSRKVATKYGLMKTPPFGEVLDLTGKISGTLSPGFLGREALAAAAVGTLGRALCGPGAVLKWAALGGLVGLFVPGVSESDVANLASVITEGSLLTRANLYSHRIEGALLSSVQNFRPGQVNFQSWPCVASLGNGALVWTSYPSAGSTLNLEISLAPVRGTTGGILGKLGGGLLGPIGAIAGAIGGYTLASKNSGPVAELEIAGRKPLKDIKIEETIFKSTHDGPNWWTGNAVQPRVVQMRSAAIIAYQAKTIQRLLFGQRTHAWFPKNQFDEVRGPVRADKSNVGGVWFFGRAGDGYLALFSANNAAWNDNGPWKDKEILSDGGRNVFIMQIGNREQFGDFGTFMKRVCGRRIHVNGLNNPFGDFQCSYDVPEGQRLELHYDDDEVHYGGVRFSDDFFPRFRNPFARVAWQQSRYAIQHKNYSLLHDIAAPKRLAGVRLEALTHDTPLLIYAQNVALLPQAPVLDFVSLYKGTDRERALALIIEILTSRGADVVGLSEVWMNADCDRICSLFGKSIRFGCVARAAVSPRSMAAVCSS